MQHRLVILLLVSFVATAQAQKEADNWYFGSRAGITFKNGFPEEIFGGQINTWEGCATISDFNGDLVFYTDGERVFNAQHNQIESGLRGDYSSTQSGVIVPVPDKDKQYYIFTVDYEVGGDGLQYSIVDMNANGGDGTVTSKNNELQNRVLEKITAVKHATKNSYWVIAHGWQNNTFYVYELTESGLQAPRTINVGSTISGSEVNSIGYMKISPNGKKLALAHSYFAEFAEVFDFDNATGNISNPVRLDNFPNQRPDDIGPYGIAFSSNNQFLYVSWATIRNRNESSKIYQFDLEAANVEQSQVMIGEQTNKGTSFLTSDYFITVGALQLAPDDKIYVANDDSPYLGIIHNPDEKGVAANYDIDGLPLSNESGLGLPTFIQSFFEGGIEANNFCQGDATEFELLSQQSYDSIQWSFDDAASGINNISNLEKPTHVFSSAGDFDVTATVYVNGTPFTESEIITIVPSIPEFSLGNDTILCSAATLTLQPNLNLSGNYLWNNNATSTSIQVGSGTYWLAISNASCSQADTITISQASDINLPNQFEIPCDSVGVPVSFNLAGATIQWHDGSTSNNFYFENEGSYTIEIQTDECTVEHTLNITKDYCFETCALQFPTAFMPSGKNKVFRPIQTCSQAIENYQMTIYNRWGETVFTTNSINEGWNGTALGNSQENVFIFHCSFDAAGETFHQQGNVMRF